MLEIRYQQGYSIACILASHVNENKNKIKETGNKKKKKEKSVDSKTSLNRNIYIKKT